MSAAMLFMCSHILMACSDSDSGNEKSKANGEDRNKKTFEEVETLDLEGPVSEFNFLFDKDGETLLWGETEESGLSEDKRRNVWMDGDVKELDIDEYDYSAMLSASGKVIKGDTNTIVEYDPRTDGKEEFSSNSEEETLYTPQQGDYIPESKMFIYTQMATDSDDADTFIEDLENGKRTDLNFVQDMRDKLGDDNFEYYPGFYVSEDGSMAYADVLHQGIFRYDVEQDEMETLSEADVVTTSTYTTPLTADEDYFIYGVNEAEGVDDDFEDFESTDILDLSFHAIDLESNDDMEMGNGDGVLSMADGNSVIIDDKDVNYFDFETEELETIYSIELEENQELDHVTISLDGSTIAYGYTTKDDDEKTSHIAILRDK